VAVGLALADKSKGRRAVTACYFGDGAVDEGEFHESMNLAALWQVPVLFLCENNRYAMGTELSRHQAITDLCAKPRAYGIEAERVDGMDLARVMDAAERAASLVRATNRPRFLELQTYRFRAHSMYDAELYRSKDEVREWSTKHDPIASFTSWLRTEGWLSDADLAGIEQQVSGVVAAAVAEAEAGALEPVEGLLSNVYTEATK
jgi:TPP-dependent pyruvate/acetoin dehydrogenase alpha subunit